MSDLVIGDIGTVDPADPAAPTRTVGDLVAQVQRLVYGTAKREVNRLNGQIAADATSLTLEFDANGVTPNSTIAINDELIHVWDVTGKTVSPVERGWLGSTAAIHADNSIIEVSPRFARFSIREALKQEIESWGPEIFGVDQITISASTSVRGYDLAGVTRFRHVLDVTREGYGISTANALPRVGWTSKTSEEFATGFGVVLTNEVAQAIDLYVTYARGYDTSEFGDARLLVQVGLSEEQFDIPVYGAAWRLLAGDEATRSDTKAEAQSRTDERVPPGFRTQTATAFKRMRDERLAAEQSRLRWAYPLRVTGV